VEINIKRATVSSNPKSRQRGDIVEIVDDRDYADVSNLTVLKIPGLEKEEYLKLVEPIYCEKEYNVFIKRIDLPDLIPIKETKKINDLKEYTFHYLGSNFIENPIVETVNDEYKLSGKILDIIEQSRFKISEDFINLWFNNFNNIKILNKDEFGGIYGEILDKAHGLKKIKDTVWYNNINRDI